MSETTLRVDIKYGDISASFSGKPDEVITAIIKFLSDNLPAIDLAKRITLSYDLQDLIQMFSDYVKITNEGPRIVADNNLSIKQKITLQLVGNKIAYLMNRIQSEPMSVQDLINVLGLPGKSISSRLSELVKAGYVARIEDQKTTKYMITTLGIKWLSDTLTGKIRAD
jgi:DNA-binding MarR family transcriptional regulator